MRYELPRPPSWMDHAACQGMDLRLFYEPDQEFERELPVYRDNREARAKRVCDRCPVREACLEEALREDLRGGVWGGMSDPDRRSLRRARRRAGAA